jgi:hypothetical protein
LEYESRLGFLRDLESIERPRRARVRLPGGGAFELSGVFELRRAFELRWALRPALGAGNAGSGGPSGPSSERSARDGFGLHRSSFPAQRRAPAIKRLRGHS